MQQQGINGPANVYSRVDITKQPHICSNRELMDRPMFIAEGASLNKHIHVPLMDSPMFIEERDNIIYAATGN